MIEKDESKITESSRTTLT